MKFALPRATGRTYLILAALVLGGLIAIFLVVAEYYPVASVNGSTISARAFAKEYRLATVSAQSMLALYAATGTPPELPARREMEAIVLNELVDRKLVAAAARQEAGTNLDELLAAKLGKYDENEELARAARVLYGLSYAAFRESVLLPQAQRDVFAARLYLRGETLEAWLGAARAEASVNIFSSKFLWKNGKVVPN